MPDALQSALDKQQRPQTSTARINTSKFKKGDHVLWSTEDLRDTVVTNLGARKLAPRIIGLFRVLKMIGDAYTLDIPSSLRFHPTFYVGRLKEYRPATLHDLVPMPNAGSHKLIALIAVLYAPKTSAAVAPSPAHVQEPGAPGSSIVQPARGSTANLIRSSLRLLGSLMSSLSF